VHLQTPPVGAQRSLITSVSCDLTCASFPFISSDPAPSPRNPLCAERRRRAPDPARSYVCPANPVRVTRPFKYYHNKGLIGRGNRHNTTPWTQIGSVKPKSQDRQRRPETRGNAKMRFESPKADPPLPLEFGSRRGPPQGAGRHDLPELGRQLLGSHRRATRGRPPRGRARTIRESADYEGVRLTLPVDLGGAELKLRLDLSFGDPITPQQIDYPTLLDGQDFRLLG
jgi:hypothetical protein